MSGFNESHNSIFENLGTRWQRASYSLRRSFPRLRNGYSESNNSKYLIQTQNYFSPELAIQISEKNLRLSLFYAWILDQISHQIPNPKTPAVRVLDLGSRHFAYAPALARLFKSKIDKTQSLIVDSLELDPYPFYLNGFRRGDAAAYFASLAEDFLNRDHSLHQVTFYQGDFLVPSSSWKNWDTAKAHRRPESHWNWIFNFFPYLFDDLHERSGLPAQSFDPLTWYQKIARSCDFAVFFHQGEQELEQALSLINSSFMGSPTSPQPVIQKFQENPWLERRHPLFTLTLASPRLVVL